jgi:hypothetical protein
LHPQRLGVEGVARALRDAVVVEMFGLAGVVAPRAVQVPGEANASLAKPQPPWTLRALLLKSVLLPRAALQSTIFWSSGLSLANKASSGSV